MISCPACPLIAIEYVVPLAVYEIASLTFKASPLENTLLESPPAAEFARSLRR